MTNSWRPRPRGNASNIGVLISRSNNFSVGGADDGQGNSPTPPVKQPAYRVRTHTGRVLEGALTLPGEPRGDLVFGVALVRVGEETSFFSVRLERNTVLFESADCEAVNGAQATVSYLTA